MNSKVRAPRNVRRKERFERYKDKITQQVRGFLSDHGNGNPSELKLVPANRGVSTLTLFVDCDAVRLCVLRCYLRRREVRFLPGTYLFCERNKLPVPRLLRTAAGFRQRLAAGFHLLFEEFIDAQPIETVLDCQGRAAPVIDALAQCLARVHNVERREYGPVSGHSRQPCLAYYVEKATRKLERIRNSVPSISATNIAAVERFVREEAGRFGRPEVFSLVHGDPSDGNVLIDQENRVTLIDLEYMHFGIPEYDLQMARHYLLRDDASLYGRFRETYESRREDPREEPCRVKGLFRIFVLLRSLPMKPADPGTERWREQWEEILSLARA